MWLRDWESEGFLIYQGVNELEVVGAYPSLGDPRSESLFIIRHIQWL